MLKDMVARIVASSAITQHQDRCRLGIVTTAIVIPPVAETVTGKFTGIMADSQLNIADIESQIIEAVRDDDTFRKATKVMIIRLEFFQRIQMAIAIEVAQLFLLLGIHADNRIAGSFILRLETLNRFKLLIAVFDPLHGLFLLRLPATIVVLLKQFAHHRLADVHLMIIPQQL